MKRWIKKVLWRWCGILALFGVALTFGATAAIGGVAWLFGGEFDALPNKFLESSQVEWAFDYFE